MAEMELRNSEVALKSMMDAYRLHRKDRKPIESSLPLMSKTQRDMSVASLKRAIKMVREARRKLESITRAEMSGGR